MDQMTPRKLQPLIAITCSRVTGGAWGVYSLGHFMDYTFSDYSLALARRGRGAGSIVPAGAQDGDEPGADLRRGAGAGAERRGRTSTRGTTARSLTAGLGRCGRGPRPDGARGRPSCFREGYTRRPRDLPAGSRCSTWPSAARSTRTSLPRLAG